jgi:hypothetical protein
VKRPKRSVLDDPDHWRGRADATRLVAEQFSDPVGRDMMSQIAQDYDRLAEHSRQQARTGEREA